MESLELGYHFHIDKQVSRAIALLFHSVIEPVVDDHDSAAGDAGDAVHLLGGERGQDEDASLVVPDAALVLHLKHNCSRAMKAAVA